MRLVNEIVRWKSEPNDLVHKHRKFMISFVNWFYQKTGTVELEDLLIEGFIALTEAAQTYKRSKGAFTTWARFYLLTSCVKAHRMSKIVWVSDTASRKGEVASKVSLDEILLSTANRGFDRYRILQAINSLEEKQKDILVQHVVHQKTFREIAESYGVTKQYINSVYQKSIKKIQSMESQDVLAND